MEIQDALLRKYMALKNQPTLQTMAEETGIQRTRIFRLFNGSEMKLSEYLAFQTSLNEVQDRKQSLESLFLDCEAELSACSLNEISKLMNSLLYKARLYRSTPLTIIAAA